MNKKLFLLLLIVVLATGACTTMITAFDLGKELKKVTETVKKEVENVKEQIEDVVEDIGNVVEKKLDDITGEAYVSWASKIKTFFSFDDLILSKLSLVYILLIAFGIGIAASLTPCIYPMIPITMGLLQSQASPSLARNFILSTSYVTGIATVYAGLGYFAATTTLILGQWLANPWFIGLLILLFLYLAFSMFGFYEIYMPRIMQARTGMKVKGSVLYSFLFGAISGTAASPCLTPPLALLLGFVAKRGNPFIGFITLFTFAFGMGLLLIVIGTFSNTITALPRAGIWMNEIKKFFGFLLLGVSIYFIQPFISDDTITIFYLALILIMLGYYAFVIAKKFTKQQPNNQN